METSEITKDARFRRAVLAGEYTRAISVFLRLQYPATEDLSTLPRDVIQGAQVAVDNAFFDREKARKEMEKEMR
jgi:hypothetical protein